MYLPRSGRVLGYAFNQEVFKNVKQDELEAFPIQSANDLPEPDVSGVSLNNEDVATDMPGGNSLDEISTNKNPLATRARTTV